MIKLSSFMQFLSKKKSNCDRSSILNGESSFSSNIPKNPKKCKNLSFDDFSRISTGNHYLDFFFRFVSDVRFFFQFLYVYMIKLSSFMQFLIKKKSSCDRSSILNRKRMNFIKNPGLLVLKIFQRFQL